MRKLANFLWLILAASLAGCVYRTPNPGETVYLKIADKLTVDAISKDAYTLRVGNALAHGASREDVKQGRLAIATCAEQTEAGPVDRGWMVKLPAGERFIIGTQTSEFVEIRPGAPIDQIGPLRESLI